MRLPKSASVPASARAQRSKTCHNVSPRNPSLADTPAGRFQHAHRNRRWTSSGSSMRDPPAHFGTSTCITRDHWQNDAMRCGARNLVVSFAARMSSPAIMGAPTAGPCTRLSRLSHLQGHWGCLAVSCNVCRFSQTDTMTFCYFSQSVFHRLNRASFAWSLPLIRSPLRRGEQLVWNLEAQRFRSLEIDLVKPELFTTFAAQIFE
jgi:hypothetical protein